MSLHAVGDAVDAGHIGEGWIKSKDPLMPGVELPTACRKCKTPWPCAVIVKARLRLTTESMKAA